MKIKTYDKMTTEEKLAHLTKVLKNLGARIEAGRRETAALARSLNEIYRELRPGLIVPNFGSLGITTDV